MVKLTLLLIAAIAITALAQPPARRGRARSFLDSRGPRRARPQTPTDPACDNIDIRTITGTCTSDADATLGEAGRAQFSYLDVDNTVPSGGSLASARFISNVVSAQSGSTTNTQGLNEMFTYFGQFVDHDFALTPFADPVEHFDIPVPEDDPEDIEELEFVRSQREFVSDTSSAMRPVGAITSALDLSNVYGSDEERNLGLRVSNSCLLKTSGDNLLPRNDDGFVNVPSTSSDFFFAGDVRANETPMLTAMHTVWVREHNRICEELSREFPDTPGPDQYEVARAINIAQYQKIIYEEWLPAILGPLNLPDYSGYRRNVDPTISVEFTTAGFRLGHTLVSEDIPLIDENGDSLTSIPAEDMFFLRSDEITATRLQNLLRGASRTPAQEFDEKVVDTLRNFLFSNVDNEEGFDLVALNLQRSRDHSMPSFNELRTFLRGSPANDFSQISSNRGTARRLRRAYNEVDNVEAWIGLVAEDKPSGAGVGRTLAALLRREFGRLRNGDQFFYLRRNQIPNRVLQRIPEFETDIYGDGNLFNRILLRTSFDGDRVIRPRRNAFRV